MNGARPPDWLVDAAIAEDVGSGDVTTDWTIPADLAGSGRIIARQAGVVAGSAAAAAVFERVAADGGADLEQRWLIEDGDAVAEGRVLVELSGPLRAIVVAERTALNFLGHLSGIATLANRFAARVEGTGARVVDTRKTTPGYRRLEKAAAAAGGIDNHRMGLYDMVLVKENHARPAGGVAAAVRAVRDRARAAKLEVEVEVTDLNELRAVLSEAPDRILLDNMDLESLRRAVALVRESDPPRPRLEASGGVSLATVRAIADTGVDFISAGAITHSAPAFDLSLQVDR